MHVTAQTANTQPRTKNTTESAVLLSGSARRARGAADCWLVALSVASVAAAGALLPELHRDQLWRVRHWHSDRRGCKGDGRRGRQRYQGLRRGCCTLLAAKECLSALGLLQALKPRLGLLLQVAALAVSLVQLSAQVTVCVVNCVVKAGELLGSDVQLVVNGVEAPQNVGEALLVLAGQQRCGRHRWLHLDADALICRLHLLTARLREALGAVVAVLREGVKVALLALRGCRRGWRGTLSCYCAALRRGRGLGRRLVHCRGGLHAVRVADAVRCVAAVTLEQRV